MTIKPIETEYNGYRFRSRLEARWAVFFDAIRAPYAYEYEGFDLEGTWYLPDFWLPEMKSWLEVKGQTPTPQELAKAEQLCRFTRQTVFVFVGEPHNPLHRIYGFKSTGGFVNFASEDQSGPIGWIVEDGHITIARWARFRGNQVNDSTLLAAYNAARYARFER